MCRVMPPSQKYFAFTARSVGRVIRKTAGVLPIRGEAEIHREIVIREDDRVVGPGACQAPGA